MGAAGWRVNGDATPSDAPRVPRPLEWAAMALAVAWLAVFLYGRWPVLRWPSFQSRVPLDNAVFAVAGDVIRRGGAPYVGYWDHKGPLIHLTDALALAMSGGGLWGIWAASLVAVAFAAVLCQRAVRRGLGPIPALLALAYFLVGLVPVHATNLTEEYALPLQWAVVLAFARWHRTPGRALALGAAVGALGMLAFFYRANLIGAAAAVGLAALATLVVERRGRETARLVAGGLLGAAAVSAVVLGYLAARGSLAAFWDQAIRFNAVYAAGEGLSKPAMLRFVVSQIGAPMIALGALGWIAAVRLAPRLREGGIVAGMALLAALWAPIELVLGTLSGRPFEHYLMPLNAALALGVGVLAASLPARPVRARLSPRVAVPLVLAALLALSTLPGLRREMWRLDRRTRRTRQIEETARFVREHTPPGEPFLVWGHDADVYALADRPPATRFLYPLPLMTPGYTSDAHVEAFLSDMRRARPRLVVEGPFMPLSRLRRILAAPSLASEREIARLPIGRIVEYLDAEYRPLAAVGPGGWRVYARADLAPVR